MAELEGHPAQDEGDHQEPDRQVEGREEDRVDVREGAVEPRADDEQPGLVAVPHRRYGAHHGAPVPLVPGGAEEDPDTEIEAVEDDVDEDRESEDRESEDRGPDNGERGFH